MSDDRWRHRMADLERDAEERRSRLVPCPPRPRSSRLFDWRIDHIDANYYSRGGSWKGGVTVTLSRHGKRKIVFVSDMDLALHQTMYHRLEEELNPIYDIEDMD